MPACLLALPLLCQLELPWVPVLLGLLELLGLELLLLGPAGLLERHGLLAEELQAPPGLLQVQGRPDLGLAGPAGLLCLLAVVLGRLLVTRRVAANKVEIFTFYFSPPPRPPGPAWPG